ncbi:MAG: tripartite tricarboxylate transporter TctB family protein [Pseudomonadota bacterium]
MSRLTNTNTLGGLTLLAFGVVYLAVGAEYPLGTLRSMGAGAFPALLGWLIIITGAVIAARGMLQGGERFDVARRPLLAISAAIASFGLTMPLFGLAPAVLVSVALSATAERKFVPMRVATLSVFLIALGYLVFVTTLGMPMQLVRMP